MLQIKISAIQGVRFKITYGSQVQAIVPLLYRDITTYCVKTELLIKCTLAGTTSLVMTHCLPCRLIENESELKHSGIEYTHNLFLV